ncbi:MAG: DUF2177 family protein [Acidobacteria bacterium]|nr:DUF2177 family protein [Acidobacteriota bacterium]
MDFLRQWAAGLVAFVVLDFIWLGIVANGFYRRELGPILRMSGDRMDPRLAPAVLFYAVFVLGLVVFALPRARAGSLAETMAWTGLFGLVAYSVYDLTNYATLQAFPLRVVVVDMAWGAVLSALTGAAMWLVRPA